MRLFVAILPENNIIRALTSAQDSLRSRQFSGRYTDRRNLHLTLAFIGEYNDPDDILELMERVRFPSFEIALSGCIGNFGDLLWAGTERSPELEKCVKQLRHVFADSRIPFDRKQFHPHFTLLRNARSSRSFTDIAVAPERMTVRGISLMRSDFGKHGAAYTEIGIAECSGQRR